MDKFQKQNKEFNDAAFKRNRVKENKDHSYENRQPRRPVKNKPIKAEEISFDMF